MSNPTNKYEIIEQNKRTINELADFWKSRDDYSVNERLSRFSTQMCNHIDEMADDMERLHKLPKSKMIVDKKMMADILDFAQSEKDIETDEDAGYQAAKNNLIAILGKYYS